MSENRSEEQKTLETLKIPEMKENPGSGMEKTPGAENVPETESEFWEWLVSHQGETFFTVKHLAFTYRIRGGEMFVDRRSKSITRSTVCGAFARMLGDEHQEIRGPKALNCFGAPYLWAIFIHLGFAKNPEKKQAVPVRKEE